MALELTIPALFEHQASRYGKRAFQAVKAQGRYHTISWTAAQGQVQALATFLISLSVKPEDRVLILSENRPEWGIADLAIQSIGAWTVPIYASLTEPEIAAIAKDCQPVVAIASTAEQAAKLRAVRRGCPSLAHVLIMNETAASEPGEWAWAAALAQGRQQAARFDDLRRRRLAGLSPERTATLIYTSGTTGTPKGVMLSHRNFLSNAKAGLRAIHITDRDIHLSFLPLCHVFERMAGWYLMIMAGAIVAYAESMDTVPQNMLEVRPTIMLGVPRFFEKLYQRVNAGLESAPPRKRRLMAWAMGLNRQAHACRAARRPVPVRLQLSRSIAERLVLAKLRQRLGGRLRFFVSGSAPLAPNIGQFFYDAGIIILEGYGLTETSPVITVNRVNALRFGTVGQPIDDVEVRIAEDGEILTRGPHIMQGYYQKPAETQAAIVDGWFHTGDIGQMDADGFLAITDRKKDLIKTAGGKFVAPQKLENLFVTDPYVSQAFVFGDRERYCVALICPNLDRARDYAKAQGLPCASDAEVLASAPIREFIWSRIQTLQRDLPSFEQVKAIALLGELTQAGGELTPTLKAKRAVIAARYATVLRRLFDGSPA